METSVRQIRRNDARQLQRGPGVVSGHDCEAAIGKDDSQRVCYDVFIVHDQDKGQVGLGHRFRQRYFVKGDYLEAQFRRHGKHLLIEH